MGEKRQYLVDFSLALINRTGAYFIGRDLLRELPEFVAEVRYWRGLRTRIPEGSSFWRRVSGRLMLMEIGSLRGLGIARWPDGRARPGRARLFLDPLYVLRSRLAAEDIVLCHDVGPVSHPDLYGPDVASLYREAYDKIAHIRPGMVFVSDASQLAFRERYGTGCRFLQTIPLYARPHVAGGAVEPCPGVRPPFLLTVGALERRKNHLRVLEAYAQSGLHERGIGYVLCGANGLGADEILKLAGKTPGVTALGYVTEPQLRWLYGNAGGFVLPSLLEGFGIPLVEAAQRGLVGVASAGGAQEEAIAGAAILVDPSSVESIRDGLVRLVDLDAPQREEILRRAARQVERLTFARYISGWRQVLAHNDRFAGTGDWAGSDPEATPHGERRLPA